MSSFNRNKLITMMAFSLSDYDVGEKLIVEGNCARVARSPHRVSLPQEYSADLAYLAGYHLGDGYLENFKGGSSFEILYADEDERQIKEVISRIIQENFRILLRVRKRVDNVCIGRINCKVLHLFMHRILGMPLGSKGNFKIPGWVMRKRNFVRAFISGFFDAEGSIFIDCLGKTCICLTNSNYEVLFSIHTILKKEFGIQFGQIYRKNKQNAFEMKARAKEAILRFCAEIGFRHPNKIQKMQEVMGRLRDVHVRKRVT